MLLISFLGYYELMDLSPHVQINDNDVISPVITVTFDVVLQVHVVRVIIVLSYFCDTQSISYNKASSRSTSTLS